MLENINSVNSGVHKRWIYSNKVDYDISDSFALNKNNEYLEFHRKN